MTLDPLEQRELLELLSASCDGRLEPVAHARLEELIRRDPGSCSILIAYSQLHTDLREHISSLHASSQAGRVLQLLIEDDATQLDHVYGHSSSPAGSGFSVSRLKRSKRVRYSLAIAAACLLVVAPIAWLSFDRIQIALLGSFGVVDLVRPPQPVAALVKTSDAEWPNGLELTSGQLLREQQCLELVAGTAQISMACGADVVLQSPCKVILKSQDVVRLERGTLTAQAATWASGFVVETNGLRVTDLGTRFVVSADSPDMSEAHVLEGKVLAEATQSPTVEKSPVKLYSGEAIRVNLRQASINRMQAESERFGGEFDQFRPLHPIKIANTGFGLSINDEDTNWRVTRSRPPDDQLPVQAVVGTPDVAYRDNAPENSQWISIPRGTTDGVPPNSRWTFETTFDLTGFDLDTVRIVGQILADNGVHEIRLNGKPISFQPWEEHAGSSKFQTFRVIEFQKGFVPGVNRIEIDVFNGAYLQKTRNTLRTPMALRVEWRAFGCPERTDAI